MNGNNQTRRPIRVGFVMDNWTLGKGGVEIQLRLLFKHLDRTRIEPFLVFALPMGETARKVVPADVPVLYLELKKLFSCSAFAKARQFRRFLKENKIDIIQCLSPDSTRFAAVVGKWSGIKTVFGFRVNIGYWVKKRDTFVGKILNRFFVDKIIANAEACKKSVVEQEGAKPENVIIIPNLIEIGRFADIPTWSAASASQPKRIGIVGNLKHVKGTDILIDAAKTVVEKFPDVQFHLAGHGDAEHYQTQITNLGLENNVHLLGSLDDIPKFLATLDIAVLASRSEGLPNAIMEYMAAGRPCVVTDVGGCGELIQNEKNGLLVPSENPSALAGALCDLLEHPERAERFAVAARNDLRENYDAPVVANRWCEIYEETLR
jgi:glycosyltransferase involved in cell wall biosynthesis